MSARFPLSLAVLALVAGAALAQPAEVPKQPDPTPATAEAILKTLHSATVNLNGVNINNLPVSEVLQRFAKVHNLTFVILEDQFKAEGNPDFKERKSNLAMAAGKDMTLHRFLTIWLAGLEARYLVRANHIEIVPLSAGKPGAGPLVSVVVKEKPFIEVIERLAEEYDLNVVVAPQSGDGKAGFVTARLKNVPPETALELLAVQCDLRVIRKDTAFLITSRDHANELFVDQLDRERQLIELQKFRDEPPIKNDLLPLPPGQLGGVPLELRLVPNLNPPPASLPKSEPPPPSK